MPINALQIITGKEKQDKRFNFDTRGEAGKVYGKVKGNFTELNREEINEAFRNKSVVEMSIVNYKQSGDTGVAAGISIPTYFSPELYDEIVKFAEKEYESSKK